LHYPLILDDLKLALSKCDYYAYNSHTESECESAKKNRTNTRPRKANQGVGAFEEVDGSSSSKSDTQSIPDVPPLPIGVNYLLILM
jgi:hypothetical protein